MIDTNMIPKEVVEAALRAYYATGERDIAAAIIASLNAWPGAKGFPPDKFGYGVIVLPININTEESDVRW